VLIAVIRPLVSVVTTGIAVEEPKVAAVMPETAANDGLGRFPVRSPPTARVEDANAVAS
jgi:hypothetical protein